MSMRVEMANINASINSINSSLADIVPQPSYESIYNLAKVKDLNIVGFGDSVTEGYQLPHYTQYDGELQPKGLANFLNTFYMDLLRKTANFLDAQIDKFTFTGTQAFNNISDTSVSYNTPSKSGIIYTYAYNNTDGSIKFNYFCKELVLWGLKSEIQSCKCGCDVYIDDVLAGSIDQSSISTDYFYPYVFQATTEGMHKIELKNFKNNGGATSGNLYFELFGISNRKHMLYNESYGGMGTNWALQNVSRVLTKNPDMVMLGFGANDCGLPIGNAQHAEPIVFYSNYMSIISQIQDSFPNCKFSIMNSVPDSNTGASNWQSAYMPLVYKIAKLKNCRIVDSWNTLNAIDTALWRVDNIHPNEYGHSVLKDLLEKIWCPEVQINTNLSSNFEFCYPSLSGMAYGACVFKTSDGKITTPTDSLTLSKVVGSVFTKINSIPVTTNVKIMKNGIGFCLIASATVVALNDILVPDLNGYWIVNNSADITVGVVAVALQSKIAGSLGQINAIIQNNN